MKLRTSSVTAALLALSLTGAVIAVPSFAGGASEATRLTMKSGVGTIDAKFDGAVRFTPAEDDVVSLDKTATISQSAGEKTYSIQFKPDGARGVARRYSINGAEQPLDAPARAWLARVIPAVLRETENDIAIDSRIKYLRSTGGDKLLMAEIGRIGPDQARSRYVQSLARLEKLTPTQLTPVLAIATAIKDEEARAAALAKLVQTGSFDQAAFTTVLASAKSMTSDDSLSLVLLAVAQRLPANPELVRLYRHSARSLGDHVRGKAEMAIDHLKL